MSNLKDTESMNTTSTINPLSPSQGFSFRFIPKPLYKTEEDVIGTLQVVIEGVLIDLVVIFKRFVPDKLFGFLVSTNPYVVTTFLSNTWCGMSQRYSLTVDSTLVFDMFDEERTETLKDYQLDYIWMVSDVNPFGYGERISSVPNSILEPKFKELFNICLYAKLFHKGNLYVDKRSHKAYTEGLITDEFFDKLVDDFNKGVS